MKDSERLEAEGPRKRTVSTESRQNPRYGLEYCHITNSLSSSPNGDSDTPVELTIEEKLLAALLGANAELLEALKQYADLERVGLERKVQDRSMIETRIDRRVSFFLCGSNECPENDSSSWTRKELLYPLILPQEVRAQENLRPRPRRKLGHDRDQIHFSCTQLRCTLAPIYLSMD